MKCAVATMSIEYVERSACRPRCGTMPASADPRTRRPRPAGRGRHCCRRSARRALRRPRRTKAARAAIAADSTQRCAAESRSQRRLPMITSPAPRAAFDPDEPVRSGHLPERRRRIGRGSTRGARSKVTLVSRRKTRAACRRSAPPTARATPGTRNDAVPTCREPERVAQRARLAVRRARRPGSSRRRTTAARRRGRRRRSSTASPRAGPRCPSTVARTRIRRRVLGRARSRPHRCRRRRR